MDSSEKCKNDRFLKTIVFYWRNNFLKKKTNLLKNDFFEKLKKL